MHALAEALMAPTATGPLAAMRSATFIASTIT